MVTSHDRSRFCRYNEIHPFAQGSGNWGAGLHKASPRAAGNGGGHGSGSGHMSNDDSPEDDGERSGSGKGGNAAKRGGAAGKDTKTKRNARQQDQNKQVRDRPSPGMHPTNLVHIQAWPTVMTIVRMPVHVVAMRVDQTALLAGWHF